MKMLDALAPAIQTGIWPSLSIPQTPRAHCHHHGRQRALAKKRGLPRIAGHKVGVSTVRSVVEDCANLGIQALTLYAFSAETGSVHAPRSTCLWRLLRYYLRHELEDLQKNKHPPALDRHVEALRSVPTKNCARWNAPRRAYRMRLNLAITTVAGGTHRRRQRADR